MRFALVLLARLSFSPLSPWASRLPRRVWLPEPVAPEPHGDVPFLPRELRGR